ncbi:hypothetical protein [Goodfellowiella coeruleoviolacea]|uniref:DUF2269 domain-containing protein n=1 Tax=Goodfellowiella coeruleoviolacea TaxID=334858 RepID=A0AAE3GGA9_9PSEU|nr:hypothetical protein [Goodfellowiella coeruleoviolacea]MCP2166815.1 hypothetical protein [Goodfellowiella coeruleoviolacea]
MANQRTSRWRRVSLWLHVITSVGWMGQALAMASLLVLALTTGDSAVRAAATGMAEHVDHTLLAPLANASAFTGFMLASATPWGFFRHWWVLAKFAITVVQLHLGIFVLSAALGTAATTAAPTVPLAVGTALMASAIAYQAWLSVAKPWSRTPWTSAAARQRAASQPGAPRWLLATALAVPADIGLGLVVGFPAPLAEVVVLAARLVARQREQRAVTPGAEARAR